MFAMIAFFAVIFSLSCFVNIWNYKSTTSGQDEILESLYAAQKEGIPEDRVAPIENIDRYSKEVPYMIRFFSIEYDEDGETNLYQEYIASLSDDDALEFGETIRERNATKGYYKGYRYLKKIDDNKTIILFLNSEREIQMMKTLLLITIIIATISLIVVFLLVSFFSKYAIAPYIKNIEAQKQFITNASHELKTPLTSISTSADVLNMEYEDNEWVKNIQSQSNKLSKLINNLVTLSRLEEETPFINKSLFSISDALWETSEPFLSLYKANEKTLKQSIEENLTYEGDKQSFQQCISILLDNANKYSPTNDEIILIAHKKEKKILISVENTCKEKIEDIDKLFDRFYRNDISHSNTVSGNGIGLSIAKATIEKQNGKIYAKQCEDKLKFIIEL